MALSRRVRIALVLAIVILVALPLAARLLFPKEKLIRIVSSRIEASSGWRSAVQNASIGVFPPGFRASDLVLSGNPAYEDSSVIRIPSIKVQARLVPLLTGKLQFTRATIEKPTIRLFAARGPEAAAARRAAGAPGKPAAGAVPLALSLDRLEMKDGEIAYRDTTGLEMTLRGVDLSLALEADKGFRKITIPGELAADDMSFAMPLLPPPGAPPAPGPLPIFRLGGVRVAATYRCLLHPAEGTLEIERGDVRVNELGGSVTGRVTNLAGVPTVDLKVAANDASVADVLSLVPNDILAQKQDLEATGRATVAAQLTGPTYPPGSMRVAGTVDLAESRVAYKGIPGAIDALAGHIRFTDERVDIDSLVARFEGEPLRVAGSILMAPTQSVDLGIAGTIPLGLFGKWPAFKAVDDLGGTVRIKAHAAGPLAAPQAMRLDGSVDLDKVTAKPRGWTAPVEGVSGRVLLAGDEAKIQGIQGRIGASDFRIDGTVRGPLGKSPVTRLELTSRLLDLDALARAAGAPVPKEMPAGAAVVGAPLLLPKLPDVSARIRVDSLVAQKLPLTNVAAQVSVLPAEGVVQVSEARAKAFTGTVGGDVRVTLAGKEPRYTFKMQGNDLEMNDFLTHFTPLKNALYGRMKLNGNFEGAGLTAQEAMAKLVANGDVIASEGRFAANPLLAQIAGLLDLPQLSEVRFKTLQSAFQVKDGRVATKDLAVDSPDAKWRAAGSVGFDGTVDYKLGILLSKPLADRAIRKVGDVARYLVNEKGELPVDLLISGSATRPTVSVDLSTAMSRVKGSALQDAARQLGVDPKTIADPKGQLTNPDAIKGLLDRVGGKPKPAAPPGTTPATTPTTPPATAPAPPPATPPATPPAPPPAKDTSAADTTRGG